MKFKTYKDRITEMEIKYPSNWKVEIDTGKTFKAYPSEKKSKTNRIYASVFRVEYANHVKKQAVIIANNENEEYDLDIKRLSDNKKVEEYTFPKFSDNPVAHILAATRDSIYLNSVIIQGKNIARGAVYDTIFASFKPGKYLPQNFDTVFVNEQADPPSKDLKIYNGADYMIQIPQNFKRETQRKDKNALYTDVFMGRRRGDSFIRVDAYKASKNTSLVGFVNQNQSLFSGAGSLTQTEINGIKALTFDYQPSDKIYGKVWFLKSDTRMFRLILNWWGPEEPLFKGVLYKSAATFKALK